MNLAPEEQAQYQVPSWFHEAEGVKPEVSVLFSYGSIVLFLGAMMSFAYASRGIDMPMVQFLQPQVVEKTIQQDRVPNPLFEKLTEELVTKFGAAIFMKEFGVENHGDYMLINFSTNSLYTLGRASLLPGAQQEVYQLAKVIQSKGEAFPIKVDTYTDDMPVIKNAWLYPTNWELSGARAASLIRVFEDVGVNPDLLQFSGHGSSQAKYPNTDEKGVAIPSNQEKNRRVVIRLGNLY